MLRNRPDKAKVETMARSKSPSHTDWRAIKLQEPLPGRSISTLHLGLMGDGFRQGECRTRWGADGKKDAMGRKGLLTNKTGLVWSVHFSIWALHLLTTLCSYISSLNLNSLCLFVLYVPATGETWGSVWVNCGPTTGVRLGVQALACGASCWSQWCPALSS